MSENSAYSASIPSSSAKPHCSDGRMVRLDAHLRRGLAGPTAIPCQRGRPPRGLRGEGGGAGGGRLWQSLPHQLAPTTTSKRPLHIGQLMRHPFDRVPKAARSQDAEGVAAGRDGEPVPGGGPPCPTRPPPHRLLSRGTEAPNGKWERTSSGPEGVPERGGGQHLPALRVHGAGRSANLASGLSLSRLPTRPSQPMDARFGAGARVAR